MNILNWNIPFQTFSKQRVKQNLDKKFHIGPAIWLSRVCIG